MPEKIISLRGPIGFKVRAEEFKAALAEAKGGPVRIEINSPGGFVFEGLDIHNLIRDHKGHTTTVLMGLAASMGSYIALAGDKVIAHDNAVYMIHNASAGVLGNHIQMRKAADNIEGLSIMLAKEYAKKTGKALADIRRMMDAETFLFGEEIKEAGFVDEIIEAEDAREHPHKDKATAISSARAEIQHCLSLMKESEAANVDFQKAAAFLDLHSPNPAAEMDYVKMDWTDEEYEAGTSLDPEMPFPNEHACRIRQPGDFQKESFRRITRPADGKDLDIIIGRLKGKTTTTTQAFRYPKGQWEVSQARKHCTDHKGIMFEPATSSDGGCGDGT